MIKSGVNLKDLAPQMALGYCIVAGVYARLNCVCTITSGNDSTHKEGSLHYVGEALDFRTHTVSRQVLDELVAGVKEALGDNFDVVLESRGLPNEHLHVEYDPK